MLAACSDLAQSEANEWRRKRAAALAGTKTQMCAIAENVYREVPDLGLRIRRGPKLLTLDPERESSAAREPLASSNDSS